MVSATTSRAIGHVSVAGSTGGTLFTWVAENASVLTVLFAAGGFVATCVFYTVSLYLKVKESNCKACGCGACSDAQ